VGYNRWKKEIIAFTILLATVPQFSHARGHRGYWYGGGFPSAHWTNGYWFHGNYSGYAGWWWVVGPTWYYYPTPYYPYPPVGARPVYVAQVQGAPLPPAAPLPAFPPSGATMPIPPSGIAPSAAPQAISSPPPGTVRSQAFSYYCEKSKKYYPLVTDCPDGWIAAPVKSPNQ